MKTVIALSLMTLMFTQCGNQQTPVTEPTVTVDTIAKVDTTKTVCADTTAKTCTVTSTPSTTTK